MRSPAARRAAHVHSISPHASVIVRASTPTSGPRCFTPAFMSGVGCVRGGHMVRGVSSRVLLLGLLLAACPPSAFAQGGRAEIAGVVLDQGKAVLPGVTVTVTNEG